MKKFFAVIAAVFSLFLFTSCGKEDINAKSEGALTYQQYAEAKEGTTVTIEGYVQGKQSWWENKATIYMQDGDGGYFIYELTCTEEQYNTDLAIGNKIQVTGYKSSWSGEVEIMGQQAGAEATFKKLDGNYVAKALDVTDKLGTDDLVKYQNMLVSFKGLTVVAKDQDNVVYYKWNNAGKQGDDIYFDVKDAKGNKYTFTVESYLCDKTTDVYKAVEGLKDGQTIDVEGFCYWYEGVQPHVTKVPVK